MKAPKEPKISEIVYRMQGVCSRSVRFTLEGDTVRCVKFENGCDGNAQGIAKLVEGMKAEDVVKRLRGIRCDRKQTSCPDQLARALEQALEAQGEKEPEKSAGRAG